MQCYCLCVFFFFFQAEDGIRDTSVTGVQTCALPISSEAGPEIVRGLLHAGADVNAAGGVTRATPLHMAARRDHVGIARVLLDAGAAIDARDKKGVTPLQRAISCRQRAVAELLRVRGASTG